MYEPEKQDYAALPGPAVAEAGAAAERPGKPVDPHRAFRILRKARLWLLLALVLGANLSFVTHLWLMPRTYESIGSLVYEGVAEVEGTPTPGEAELPTLVDSVKLPASLRAVRDRVGFDGTLDVLGARITVDVEPESNVMHIGAQEDSAEGAAELANTMAEVFIAQRTGVEQERLEEFLEVVEEDLRVGLESLAEARTDYNAFRDEHGIADLTTEQENAIEAAAELRAQADMAGADALAEDARLRQLRQAERQSRRTVVTETQSSPEATELGRIRSELAQARANLSDDHPRVQALQHQAAALEARVASGSHTVTGRVVGVSSTFEALQGSVQGSAAAREAARQREESLGQLAENARERIERLNEIEGQASTLLAAVRVSEEHASRLEARKRLVLDALRTPSSGFRLVSEALPAETAMPSRTRWVVAAAIPLVLVFLVLLVFVWRELRGFRAVTPLEIGYWAHGPVVGATTWPRQSTALHELASELDDYVPDARGVTLVIGATAAEERLATQLADRLRDDWQPTTLLDDSGRPVEGKGRGGAAANRASKPASTALVVREEEAIVRQSDAEGLAELDVQPYQGPYSGPRLRRAVRLADRVLVVVPSDTYKAVELAKLHDRLGRKQGVGFVVVGLDEGLGELPDRTGDVASFWLSREPTAKAS